MKFFFVIPLIIIGACASVRPVRTMQQGISGFVYLQAGNQMPAHNRPRSNSKPLSTGIAVYQSTTVQQAEGVAPIFTRIKTKLIAETRSDSTGHYQVNLPVGKYSVFIKTTDGYYAAETDDQGVLNAVTVIKNQVSARNLIMRGNALY